MNTFSVQKLQKKKTQKTKTVWWCIINMGIHKNCMQMYALGSSADCKV